MNDRTQRYELHERIALKRQCRRLNSTINEYVPDGEYQDALIQVWGEQLTYADFQEILRCYIAPG